MKVQELIELLYQYNRNADIQTVVKNYTQPFQVSFGGSDGCTKETCDTVSICIGVQDKENS